MSLDDFDLYDDLDAAEPRSRDVKIDEAKAHLLENIFSLYPRETFYERQLQVLIQNDFYRWLTAKALHELALQEEIQTAKVPLGEKTFIRFIFRRKIAIGNGKPKKFANSFCVSRRLRSGMVSATTQRACSMPRSRISASCPRLRK